MELFLRGSLKWALYTWFLCYASVLAFIPIPKFSGAQTPLRSGETGPKQVAVIGAGAAGASTAYNLRKYADSFGIPVNVTVFERAPYVGGRSTTVNVFDDPAYPIELGASIFVEVNYNLVNASKELGLNVRGASYERPMEAETLGVWDGKEFVFVMEDSASWWTIGKLLWRYGLAPIRTRNLMQTTVNKFLQLYNEPLFPFRSLTAAAEEVGLLDATSATGTTFLEKNSVSDGFSREVIQASTRVNYGQNLPLIHGLESMVCMATDGAVSIEGGNWRIFDGMLKASQADVRLNQTVTSITRKKDNTVTINVKDENTSTQDESPDFDEVVIAGPYQYSDISISPEPEHIPDTIPFHTLHVTLFSSPHRLSGKYFNLRNPSDLPPETILTTLPGDTNLGDSEDGVGPAGFWSISTLRTVDVPGAENEGKHYVYKIFSPNQPTASFIRDILGLQHDQSDSSSSNTAGDISDLPKEDISWSHSKIWHPYPFLYPRVTFEEPVLAPGVWYTGGIESFISTMETSALMGRNVAALIVENWAEKEGQGIVGGFEGDVLVDQERGEL
ncbi:hypothetical protein BDV06DRAFT_203960 [Aspergillus oleicola]